MYRITKPLNHNALLAFNMDDAREYLVVGRGVGFGRKPGERVEDFGGAVEPQRYLLSQAAGGRGDAHDLLARIDPVVLDVAEGIYEDVRDSAYAIIERKGATYYGIAMAVARIAECIVRDEQAVLPVSTVLGGEYGLTGLALSIPSVVGKDGVQAVLELPLDTSEREALAASAGQLREVIASLDASETR